MSDPTTTTTPEQLVLDVVLTCCTCDQTYTPTDEDLVRGHFGCPHPGCGGWTFSSALTGPTTQGGWRR